VGQQQNFYLELFLHVQKHQKQVNSYFSSGISQPKFSPAKAASSHKIVDQLNRSETAPPIFQHKVLLQERFVQSNQHNLGIRATLDNANMVLVCLMCGCITLKQLHQSKPFHA
jgi:hypothetical protein